MKNEESVCACKNNEIRPFGKILRFARLAEDYCFEH